VTACIIFTSDFRKDQLGFAVFPLLHHEVDFFFHFSMAEKSSVLTGLSNTPRSKACSIPAIKKGSQM
jgi:hypothetical protein